MNLLKDALRRRLEEEDDHEGEEEDHEDEDHDEEEDHEDEDHDEEEGHDDHDEEEGHDDHAEVERWDAWNGWWLPWLWTCVDVLAVKAPGEMFTNWLRETMAFLTNHEFAEGGH